MTDANDIPVADEPSATEIPDVITDFAYDPVREAIADHNITDLTIQFDALIHKLVRAASRVDADRDNR